MLLRPRCNITAFAARGRRDLHLFALLAQNYSHSARHQVDEEQLKSALEKIDMGDRDAFRAVFDNVGPYVAEQLSKHRVSSTNARAVFVETFGQLWDGTCHFPNKSDVSHRDGIASVALGLSKPASKGAEALIAMDEALWSSVTKRAYPESWRNMLRRLDVPGAIVCALVSAFMILLASWL